MRYASRRSGLGVVNTTPVLYLFSGLPGTGKTTLAQNLARKEKAAYLRIDTVEQALRDSCGLDVQDEGYGLSYRIARDNLRLGVSVVADACNALESVRAEWARAALDSGSRVMNVEVICSDRLEHRRRVETRRATVAGLRLPTWPEVERREYHAWTKARIVIDTAGKSPDASFAALLAALDLPV